MQRCHDCNKPVDPVPSRSFIHGRVNENYVQVNEKIWLCRDCELLRQEAARQWNAEYNEKMKQRADRRNSGYVVPFPNDEIAVLAPNSSTTTTVPAWIFVVVAALTALMGFILGSL